MADGLRDFDWEAQQVLALARRSADKHQHNYIAPEHIADAMVKRDRAVHFAAWRMLEFDSNSFHKRLLESMPQGGSIGIGNIPYTPEVKKLFAVSVKEAARLGHDWVGTEHFLLAFFGVDTPVSALFQSMGLTHVAVEEAVLAELEQRSAAERRTFNAKTQRRDEEN